MQFCSSSKSENFLILSYFFVHFLLGRACQVYAQKVSIEGYREMASIAGTNHILIIDHENAVWTAGSNLQYQLGRDDIRSSCLQKSQGLPPIKLVAAGSEHSLFLDFEGMVWTCGTNITGALGLDIEMAVVFTQIPTTFVAQSIACGSHHSYILDVDGCVWGCGNNEFGQLGKSAKCQYSKSLQKLALPLTQSVHALGSFGIFLDHKGRAWATGLNDCAQLGLGDRRNREKPCKIKTLPPIQTVACGGNRTLFLDYNGVVWACGENVHSKTGQLVLVPEKIQNIPEVVAIAGGWYHSLMLDVEGCVWVSGRNYYSQLGLNISQNSCVLPTKLTNLPRIKQIGSGYYHLTFVDYEGNVWVCGQFKQRFLGFSESGGSHAPEKIPWVTICACKSEYQTKSARFVNC